MTLHIQNPPSALLAKLPYEYLSAEGNFFFTVNIPDRRMFQSNCAAVTEGTTGKGLD